MAKHTPKAMFQSMVPNARKAILHVLSDPEGTQEERLVATENALISIALLAARQSENTEDFARFVNALPL
jgi:hypothetical protein